MKFKLGDRVIITKSSRYVRQNKDAFGKVYEGTITMVREKERALYGGFMYSVKWDKGASSTEAYYNDKDLESAFNPSTNKEAKRLLTKEW